MKLYNILLEYSDKLINSLIEKFKKEDSNLSDENIKYYINQFDKRKSNPKIIEKDITKYSFKELEKLIDSLPTKEKVVKTNDVEFSESELIYNQSPLQIFHGDSPQACIKIKGDFSASWCVARKIGNLYHNYRYQDNQPSFYFVKNIDRLNNIKKLEDDPYCFFVIQVTNINDYIVTNALNNGDKKMEWDDILEIEPLLSGKQDLFKNIPLNGNEKEYYKKFKNGISDEKYKNLSYDEKRIYIAIKNELEYNKFINTPDELLNYYINLGIELSEREFDFIKNKQKILNNYRRITLNYIIPEYLKNRISSLGTRWATLTDEEAYNLYTKKPYKLIEILTIKPNLIKYFPPNEYDYNDETIVYLLTHQPSLITYFEKYLNKLSYSDMVEILSYSPETIKYFEKYIKYFDDYDIVNILSYQPKLITYFIDKLDILNSENISDIISKQPTLLKYFKNKLDKLNENNIYLILATQPNLIKYFINKINDINFFSGINIERLITKQPTLVKYFKNNLKYLDTYLINQLILNKPNLIDYFKDRLNEITINKVYYIIIKHPSLISYFENRLNELSIKNVTDIIITHPSLISYFENRLKELDIPEISFISPELKNYFKEKGLLNESLKLYNIILEYSDKLI